MSQAINFFFNNNILIKQINLCKILCRNVNIVSKTMFDMLYICMK
jgi:hypothetical protein